MHKYFRKFDTQQNFRLKIKKLNGHFKSTKIIYIQIILLVIT